MSDEFSIRDNMENDANEAKNDLKAVARPIDNKIRDKIEDEIGNRIAKHIAEEGVKNAARGAAQTAGTASAAGAAGAVGANAAAEAGAAAAGTGAVGGAAVGSATAGGAAAGGAVAGGAVAEGAAAGAAGGPVGIVVGVILGAVVAMGAAIKNETDISLDKDDPDGPKINAFFLAIVIFLLGFTTLCGTLISKGVASTVSVGQETEFQNTIVDGQNMALAGQQYKEGTSLMEFNTKLPLKNAIWQYTFGRGEEEGTYGDGTKEGLRKTLSNAIRKHCKNIVQQLEEHTGEIGDHPYDSERSLDSFYQNKWPYDLRTSDQFPKIGDVLIPDTEFYGHTYEAWNPRYDDVNYAEIFAVFSMTDTVANGANYGFDWGDVNYKDFMEYLQKEECYKYMYELGLKWVPVYRGEKVVSKENDPSTDEDDENDTITIEAEPYEFDSPDECREAPDSVTWDGVTCDWEEYYVKVKVKPMGLRELFAMAFDTDDPVSASNQMHVNFDQHQNMYMLGYIERVTRLYQRDDKVDYVVDGVVVSEGNDPLGPSFKDLRSYRSSVYWDVNNSEWLKARGWQGKGRSPWYYIETTYNDKFDTIEWEEDPGGSEPPGNFEIPEGGKILDMYEYINQGDYPNVIRGASGATVKKSGCLDCSVAMIAMYFKRFHIPITEVCKHVDSEGSLHASDALAEYGLKSSGSIGSNVIEGVISEINADRPVILHIRGYWTSGDDGRVLHGTTNGHFLVGMGYDQTGLYVYDPGKRANYHISYEDWSHVNDLYYRRVTEG